MEAQSPSKLSDPFFCLIVFSIYSGVMGAVLLLVPRIILPAFQVHEEVNSFTFMLGFVLLCSSFYYFASGLGRNRLFAKLTLYTRIASPIMTVSTPRIQLASLPLCDCWRAAYRRCAQGDPVRCGR